MKEKCLINMSKGVQKIRSINQANKNRRQLKQKRTLAKSNPWRLRFKPRLSIQIAIHAIRRRYKRKMILHAISIVAS